MRVCVLINTDIKPDTAESVFQTHFLGSLLFVLTHTILGLVSSMFVLEQ